MVQASELQRQLLEQYGPLMGGEELSRALGFRTTAAMKKAWREGVLRLSLFRIEGRRGLFCLTGDVAAWLAEAAAQVPGPAGQFQRSGGKDAMT